ncbi:RDD family protein [Sporosarcina sp. CAU 1771]
MSETIEYQASEDGKPSYLDRTNGKQIMENERFSPKVAGFWIRFWAYSIDLLIIYAISGILIKPLFRVADLSVSSPIFLFFNTYKITALIMLLLYFALMTKFFQQTIGKMIFGVKVVSNNGEKLTWGAVVFREVFGRFISKMLLIPYLLPVFMPRKEALHDLFADTYVVHEYVYEKGLEGIYPNKTEQLPEGRVV